jgi:hypothetical protein
MSVIFFEPLALEVPMQMKPMKNVKQLLSVGALGLLCFGTVVPAAATPINLSTGFAAYTITADTNGEGLTPIDVSTPLPGGWISTLSNGVDSGVWIAPVAGQAAEPNTVSGSTTYQLTFSLSGLNPSTAVLAMNLAADDYVSVTLNGTSIFSPSSTQIANGMWTASTGTFDVTSGFNSGMNTLIFTVPNFSGDGTTSCCGPTGLDVAASVTANSAVPEPATFGLAGLALAGLGLLRLRKGTS